ncbi:tRNA (guanine(26)-N(2))-dimethyltransferase [Salarchaeum sp. III]|uniref:tRNA (guanine(26)-N(2))-dimethyltransferase n=1 Tax=Salarchaeum sp. III TaxID=3107927 RepID=UPI002ED96B5B
MLVEEGAVTVEVESESGGGEGAAEGVFFNPGQELNRDITVAALRAYGERTPEADSYLDATAASGIRGVRAANEGWDATLCDTDPDAVELARRNLERNDLQGTVVHQDANAVLHDKDAYFDVVDVDPFGTPIPFADAALANARDLVCVTATDTAPLCGAHFESGVRKYSTVPRNTEYHAEMGLRVLLGAFARTAARYDVGVTPILSHVSDHYVRTYLDLSHRATDANAAVDDLGYIHHCEACLHRWTEKTLLPESPDACPNCGEGVQTAGPVWLGAAHDAEFVEDVVRELTGEMGSAERAERLLERVAGELHEPTHYDQHKLYKRWNEPAVGMNEFLDAVRDGGYEASRAHYGGTTFKTTASVAELRDLAP